MKKRLLAALGALLTSWNASQAAELRFETIETLRAEVVRRMQADGRFSNMRMSADDPAVILADVAGPEGAIAVESNVRNLFGYLNAYGDLNADEQIGIYLHALIVGDSHEGRTDLLVANVRTTDYVRELEQGGGDAPMYEPFVGDLAILYQYDLPESLQTARWEDFGSTRPRSELREIATGNVASWLPQVVEDSSIPGFSLFYIEGNPSLSPGLLLLDDFWRSLEGRFPNGMLVIAPRRDQIFVVDKGLAGAADAARRMVEVTRSDSLAFLSDDLFEWRNGALHPYAP